MSDRPIGPEPGSIPDLRDHAVLVQAREERLRELRRPFRRRAILYQLLLFALVMILWGLPIFNPIKLIVVVFHEISHVVMAYLTGGVVFGIAIDPGGAGVTIGMGGNEILIVAAGYVGSLLFGCLLYALSSVWKADEVWAVLLLACCVSMAFGWFNSFTAFFGFGTMTLMTAGLFLFSEDTQKFLIRWVATTSCLYPVLDVGGEFLAESPEGFRVRGVVTGSDVAQFSALTGASETAIAVVWAAMGLTAVSMLVYWSSRKDADVEVKKTFFYKRRLAPILYHKYDPSNPTKGPRYEFEP